jgi:V/A-type H+-transporting ATPase subunit D
MPAIKHTKNELKAQREALRRFERFLPMLQLKKQQLQMEIQSIDAAIAQKKADEERVIQALRPWLRMFADPFPIESLLSVESVGQSESNIAGVTIPVFAGIFFKREPIDLFDSPPWIDEGLETLEQLISLHTELDILAEQRRLIVEELRSTSQRVNLFEKVKIPESREHIRIIKIFLGDEQTAGVARAKNAKNRSSSRAADIEPDPLERSA